jgi:hypothetical protein
MFGSNSVGRVGVREPFALSIAGWMQGALAACAATKIIGGTTRKIERIAIAGPQAN